MFGFAYFNRKVYMLSFLYKVAIEVIIFELGLSAIFLRYFHQNTAIGKKE